MVSELALLTWCLQMTRSVILQPI